MGQKIVFFDIDGTLLNADKQISTSAQEAINLLQQNGVLTAFATGRAPFMFENLRSLLNMQTFVSFNGQYVEHEGAVIHAQALQLEDLESLNQYATAHEHPLVYMHEDGMYANQQHHPYIEESIATLKVDMPAYDPFFYKKTGIYQVLLFCQQMHSVQYLEQFSHLRFIRWHDLSVDVLPQGGSKAAGISQLIAHLGLDYSQVYAFGDASNDVEMLQAVGTGIAMGNASQDAIDAADMVTDRVEEDGIYNGLKRLGLI